MAHQRTLIRQAGIATVIAAGTAAGARVLDTRIDPIRKSDLPLIAVYTESEEVASGSSSTAPRELTRTLELRFDAYVANSDAVPVALAMDNIAAQIEAALDGNRYLTVARTITAVDPVTDQLTIAGHGLTVGTGPAFVTSSGTMPGGTARGQGYLVIPVDANTVKIAASIGDAIEGTAIDLTDAGSGTLQLVVSNAADSILQSIETDVVEPDGHSDPLVGIVTLTYSVTYRTSPATDAPAVLPDLSLINAQYLIVGATADTPAAIDQFNPRT